MHGVDGAGGMGDHIRRLSSRKLDEVEALLERTRAMKRWLEVAKECGCAAPDACTRMARAAAAGATRSPYGQLDRTPLGRDEEGEAAQWIRCHDEYEGVV